MKTAHYALHVFTQGIEHGLNFPRVLGTQVQRIVHSAKPQNFRFANILSRHAALEY